MMGQPEWVRIRYPCLLRGPVMADPRLPRSRSWLLNLVITRGTPPRLEGCRPASRGLALALMTDREPIVLRRSRATGSGGDPLRAASPRWRSHGFWWRPAAPGFAALAIARVLVATRCARLRRAGDRHGVIWWRPAAYGILATVE